MHLWCSPPAIHFMWVLLIFWSCREIPYHDIMPGGGQNRGAPPSSFLWVIVVVRGGPQWWFSRGFGPALCGVGTVHLKHTCQHSQGLYIMEILKVTETAGQGRGGEGRGGEGRGGEGRGGEGAVTKEPSLLYLHPLQLTASGWAPSRKGVEARASHCPGLVSSWSARRQWELPWTRPVPGLPSRGRLPLWRSLHTAAPNWTPSGCNKINQLIK